MVRHVLVVADSLAFHGPDRPHQLEDGRLWPNVMAAGLGDQWRVDLVARLGWTARDAWWAITKDPRLWGRVVPRADALVLSVGGMDHLPAAIPTYLRDGIPYLRPASLRRRVRQWYRSGSPLVIRASGGRMRQLPQRATDRYLTRIADSVRHFNEGLPVALIAPSPYASSSYPSVRHHASAVAAARRWGKDHGAAVVGVDHLVLPSLRDGSANPDGIHWSWVTHRLVGEAVAAALLSWPNAIRQPDAL